MNRACGRYGKEEFLDSFGKTTRRKDITRMV